MNIVKFNKSIHDYRYILAFDIAKHQTGWALIDLSDPNIVSYGAIVTEKGNEWADFYAKSKSVMDLVRREFGSQFFVIKERLPNQAGKFSTIATLQGLAGAHAIFDLVCAHSEVDVYDADGIHSISVKSYFKSLTEKDKPDKADIANAIRHISSVWEEFDNYDITDAAACAIALVNKKWNADIAQKVKELKSEQKKYKTEKKHLEIQSEIDRILGLKIWEG